MFTPTCCECGAAANLDFEVDGTGRMACSQAHRDKLVGKGLPDGKRQGWYCNGHKDKVA